MKNIKLSKKEKRNDKGTFRLFGVMMAWLSILAFMFFSAFERI